MSWPAVALLASTAAYTGFQWTIRALVYPQFTAVDPAGFSAYEAHHQRRVAVVVGPLFAALIATTAAVVIAPPHHAPGWAVWAPVALGLVVLGTTAFLAVPLHERLRTGFDRPTYRRLLVVDSVRLTAAVLDTVAAVVLVAA